MARFRFKLALVMTAVLILSIMPFSAIASTTGLIGLWSFNEVTGAIAEDSSGYDNHATIRGSVEWSTNAAPIPGNEYSLLFGGVSGDWVEIQHEAHYNVDQITMSAWIFVDPTIGSGDKTVIRKGVAGSTAGARVYGITLRSNGSIRGWIIRDNNIIVDADGGAALAKGAWHHVAVTYDGQIVIVYVNGGLYLQSALGSGIIGENEQKLGIGGFAGVSTPGWFKGNIDEVAIYNRALTAAEVKALWDRTPPVTIAQVAGTENLDDWYVSLVTVTLAATDFGSGVVAYTEYSYNGTDWSTYTAPVVHSTDGEYTFYYRSADDVGNVEATKSVSFKIDQTKPTLTWGTPTPGANTHGWNNTNVSISYTTDDNLSGVASALPASPLVFDTEGENQTQTVTVTDNAGNSETFTSFPISIDKTAPVITAVSVTPDLVSINTPVQLSVTATDNLSGIATYEYRIDGGVWVEMTTNPATHTPTAANVYTIEFRVTDKADNESISDPVLLVVYDPDGGFVTGGGWIWSPKGAYAADEYAEGKATFGFVSRYQRGANVPTGNTQFVLHVDGGFTFRSTSYEWLVISGARAQYKGVGRLNGVDGYGFMLTAIDGDVNGGGGVDKFRIKIWVLDGGAIVYDNLLNADDTAENLTALGGGSIVIHTPPANGRR